jgi:hypothetical protein
MRHVVTRRSRHTLSQKIIVDGRLNALGQQGVLNRSPLAKRKLV